jgi:hypothetical protein
LRKSTKIEELLKIVVNHEIEEVVEIEVNCKIEEEVNVERGARFARMGEICEGI